MNDHAPHRCWQHALMQIKSIYAKSAWATSIRANVSQKQLLMAATNKESSSNISAAMSQPKFIVHQGPLAPNSQKVTNMETLWPSRLSFPSKHGNPSHLPNFSSAWEEKKLIVGDKSSLVSIITHLIHIQISAENNKAMTEAESKKGTTLT